MKIIAQGIILTKDSRFPANLHEKKCNMLKKELKDALTNAECQNKTQTSQDTRLASRLRYFDGEVRKKHIWAIRTWDTFKIEVCGLETYHELSTQLSLFHDKNILYAFQFVS